MFTGIVSGLGALTERDGSRFVIDSPYKPETLNEGASVACDGCCLTLVEIGKGQGDGSVLAFELSNETLGLTTLGSWQAGQTINLERALALGEELGGHIVTGHVDGRAKITARGADGDNVRFELEAPSDLAGLIATKGSVALDGVSLTVNEVGDTRFGVNVIPYTLAHTTLRDWQPGDLVNLEVDLLARYVARLGQYEGRQK
jgi:riboflavin synthase